MASQSPITLLFVKVHIQIWILMLSDRLSAAQLMNTLMISSSNP